MIQVLKAVFSHFFDSDTFQKGAALAYYAVFSIFPIIIITSLLLGLFFGEQAVAGDIYKQLNATLGKDAALQIQEIIKNQHRFSNGILMTIIGFASLAFSASGMLGQIHNAFNKIWNIKEKPKNGLKKYISKQVISFVILIVLFFIIFLSTTLNSFLSKHAAGLHIDYKLLFVYEHLISFVFVSLIFAVMFKYLGDAIIHWKSLIYGGLFTAFFFLIGKIGISMYIGHSHISSTFGAASVLALIMLWVYYTSQIIFLGASFVKIISEKMHCAIQANEHAVLVEHKEVD